MRWVASLAVVAVFGVLAVGSEVSKTDSREKATSATASASAAPLAEVNPRLREDVIAAVKPFDKAEYAPKDPAFVDPCIRDAIAHTESGSAKYDERVASAARCIMRKLAEDPEGQKVLEKILAERYAKPVIVRDGDVVRVQLGQVAGKPQNYTRIRVQSDLWDSAGLVPSEVVKHLLLGMKTEPGAGRYQVEVENEVVKSRSSTVQAPYTYVWRKSTKTIAVYTGESRYCETAPLPDDLSGLKSLHWSELTCGELKFGAGGYYDPRKTLDR